MSGFEYMVQAAPTRGKKSKGVKTPADRFAFAMQEVLNTNAKDGWEFVRAETLPAEERDGLMSKTTVFQNVLVFRRPIADPATADFGETVEEHIEEALEADPEPALIEDHTENQGTEADDAPTEARS